MVLLRTIPKSLVFAVVCNAVSLSYCIYHYLKGRRRDPELSEVIFFDDRGESSNYPNIRRFVEYLESAHDTLDAFIYPVICQELADAIVRVHKRGRRVRIIADSYMAEGAGSRVAYFRKHGVPIRIMSSAMPEKFFIVDGHFLLKGSWPMQAVTDDWDYVLVLSTVHTMTRNFDVAWRKLGTQWCSFVFPLHPRFSLILVYIILCLLSK
ncbi:uncharacterized protein [Anabrus simplex]|uniref:uncharacterized protein n=1 Tax=Anabrus simplex TaxID=316456 RepID=UPI0034DD52C7